MTHFSVRPFSFQRINFLIKKHLQFLLKNSYLIKIKNIYLVLSQNPHFFTQDHASFSLFQTVVFSITFFLKSSLQSIVFLSRAISQFAQRTSSSFIEVFQPATRKRVPTPIGRHISHVRCAHSRRLSSGLTFVGNEKSVYTNSTKAHAQFHIDFGATTTPPHRRRPFAPPALQCISGCGLRLGGGKFALSFVSRSRRTWNFFGSSKSIFDLNFNKILPFPKVLSYFFVFKFFKYSLTLSLFFARMRINFVTSFLSSS